MHSENLMAYYKDYSCGKTYQVGNNVIDEKNKLFSSQGKRVVCVMNGNFENGGLADRLRTIISTYQVCKEIGVEFRLLFTNPFLLKSYLMPNRYDWRINEEEVHFDYSSEVVCCEVTDDTEWQSQRVHKLLSKRIEQSKSKEIHVYGNPNFCYSEGTYRELFDELFTLSPSLEALLRDNLKEINSQYNVMQLRFTTLLGDLSDIGEVLPVYEQQELMKLCLSKIKSLKSELPSDEVLVINSDSMKFLEIVKQEIPDAFVVSGKVVHIDYTEGSHDDAYMKLFVDFFLMTRAQCVYRIIEKRMRKSGLPYSAAMLSGKECKDICF